MVGSVSTRVIWRVVFLYAAWSAWCVQQVQGCTGRHSATMKKTLTDCIVVGGGGSRGCGSCGTATIVAAAV